MAVTNAQLESRVVALEKDVKNLSERIERIEGKVEGMNEINNNLTRLATSVEFMAKEQQRQGKLLDVQTKKITEIETAPIKETAADAKYYKREIIKCVIITIIGAILGALLTYIIKK